MYEEYMKNFFEFPYGGYKNTYDQYTQNYYGMNYEPRYEYDMVQNYPYSYQTREKNQAQNLEKYYPEILKSRYNLENLDDFEEAYNIIAKKIGALNKGGEADYRRVSTYIINEIKLEKIKNITFDKVEDL